MIANIIGFIVLLAVTVLFAWLVARVWRARNPFLKWLGVVLLGLLTGVLAVVSVVTGIGLYKLYGPRGNPVVEVTVAQTPELVARGEHIASVVCSSCHTLDGNLPLTGGKDFVEEIGLPLGSFTPANLTAAGRIKNWTDGQLKRAIREAADPDGRFLAIMSSNTFSQLGEEDLNSVVAYLRSQPAVGTKTPEESFTLLGAIFMGAGMLPTKPVPSPTLPVAPPRGPTAEYGAYIARYLDCYLCHGPDLQGGGGGFLPKGPSLRAVKGWTQEQFATTLRTGRDPHGHELDPVQMPWKFFGRMDDQELAAVYEYLKSLA